MNILCVINQYLVEIVTAIKHFLYFLVFTSEVVFCITYGMLITTNNNNQLAHMQSFWQLG